MAVQNHFVLQCFHIVSSVVYCSKYNSSQLPLHFAPVCRLPSCLCLGVMVDSRQMSLYELNLLFSCSFILFTLLKENLFQPFNTPNKEASQPEYSVSAWALFVFISKTGWAVERATLLLTSLSMSPGTCMRNPEALQESWSLGYRDHNLLCSYVITTNNMHQVHLVAISALMLILIFVLHPYQQFIVLCSVECQ